MRATPASPSGNSIVSLLLPCDVVVETVDAGSKISTVDPLDVMADRSFSELGGEVSTRLRSAGDAFAPGARRPS